MDDLSYLASFGIGSKYIPMKFDDFHDQKVVTVLKKYIDNYLTFSKEGKGLLFTGCNGSGKTMLATIVLKNLIIKYGILGYCMDLDKVLELLSQSWKNDDIKTTRNRKVYGSHVLLLDNVSYYISKSRDVKEVLPHILRRRMDYNRTTFLTVASTGSDISSILGKEVYNLLQESCIQIKLPEVNFRKDMNNNLLKILKENDQ